ncbi:MAG: DivIVA domain-containing protein [Acidobacteriota bacterium]|nr:DivIVA domain-containing protein [Acidobacteriota bacterium]
MTFAAARRGYRPAEVDRYLEDIAAQLRTQGRVKGGPLSAAGFRLGPRGYDTVQVDAFLQEISSRLGAGDAG